MNTVSVTNNSVHACYSDFSHLASQQKGDISNLTFAVGLRIEDADAEMMVAKILPMTKIIPAEIKPRLIRKKKSELVNDDKILCTREDCTARREYYAEIQQLNFGLRNEVKDLENKVSLSKNKIVMTEKSIQMQEDKNEIFRGLIEETQAKQSLVLDQIKEVNTSNQYLREHLELIQKDIDDIKRRGKEAKDRLAEVMNNKNGPSVTFSSTMINSNTKKKKSLNDIRDVLNLKDEISESDDDEDS